MKINVQKTGSLFLIDLEDASQYSIGANVELDLTVWEVQDLIDVLTAHLKDNDYEGNL